MKPEHEWFRKPTWYENLMRRGDSRPFFVVAEPSRGQVAGVFYECSEELLLVTPFGILEKLKEAAEGELRRRIENNEFHGEGEVLEVFRWHPMICRSMSGRLTVQTDREYILWGGLSGVTEGKNEVIKAHEVYVPPGTLMKNLYDRPGRFFPVKDDNDGTEVGPRS